MHLSYIIFIFKYLNIKSWAFPSHCLWTVSQVRISNKIKMFNLENWIAFIYVSVVTQMRLTIPHWCLFLEIIKRKFLNTFSLQSHLIHLMLFFFFFLDLLSILLQFNFEKYVCVCVCIASVDSKFLVFVYLEMSYNHS